MYAKLHDHIRVVKQIIFKLQGEYKFFINIYYLILIFI